MGDVVLRLGIAKFSVGLMFAPIKVGFDDKIHTRVVNVGHTFSHLPAGQLGENVKPR